jgi:AraC-like DNA-binding protein
MVFFWWMEFGGREHMACTLSRMGYYRSPAGGAPAPYRIPEGEVLFELITDGAVYPPEGEDLCGVGWVFVHQPGQQTIWRTEPEGHYECMTASFDLAMASTGPRWPRAFFWDDEAGVVHFAHEMLHAFHHMNVDREVLGDYVLSQLRFRLDLFGRHESRSEIPARLATVISFMDQHYADSIGIEVMAGRVGLSASHLHAQFREFINMSPHQYLIRQRMRAARHMLATSTEPIKAIARNTGYINTENFCRAFRQHVGLTAAAYRRTYRIYP